MADLNVLIIEDNPVAAETLERGLKERFNDIEIGVQEDFDNALSLLTSHSTPEILILDLYEDGFTLEDLSGQKIWETIWRETFIPIVIYTAGAVALQPDPPQDNPFIRIISKGEGSDLMVADYIESIEPYVQSLRAVRNEVNSAMQAVLKESSQAIWKLVGEDVIERSAILVRLTRRRLAAMMDMHALLETGILKGWEQYIFPPLEQNLLTGDILFLCGEDPTDPSSFRLVLSPSCDLVVRSGGGAKLDRVLVAKCELIDKYLECVRSSGRIKKGKIAEALPRFLSQPHIGGYIPLPALEGIIPAMAANLRDLDLIRMEEISPQEGTDPKFCRVASIDSPFREQIAWAFHSISGRPGIPLRDLDEWAEEITSSIQE
jgi:CheY-like chemotaxis protein